MQLYHRRWQVEVDFRDLKDTLQIKQLRSRTQQGVQKELAALVILYNLIRQTMVEAARRQGVTPDRISFIDAADWLLWSPLGGELPVFEVNPIRRRRTQPRKLKHCPRRYARLNQPRQRLALPPYEAKL